MKSRAGGGGFSGWLAARVVGHPKLTLVIAALVPLAAAPGVMRLTLRTDGHALISESAPEVSYDRTIRDQFGIEDQLVVLIRSRHPDGVFNPGTLQLVRELTAALTQMPGMKPGQVMSLATEPSFRLRPGTLSAQKLLEPPLRTKAELDQLREDLRRIRLYTGTLVSFHGQSTVILVGVPNGANRSEFYTKVRHVLGTRKAAPEDISVTGAPVAESLLGVQILEDLGVPRALLGASVPAPADEPGWRWPASLHDLRRLVSQRIGLVPMAALVMMLVLLLGFRNVVAALLPLPGVVATMLFVFGLMGWCGVPIYLATAVMPVLLTVISVTNDIYLFNRYFNLLHAHPTRSQPELVAETLERLIRPVACTSLTAVIGFGSFGLSPLVPVRAFGLFTGIGAVFGLVFSLTAVPALLVLIHPAWLLARRGHKPGSALPLAAGFSRLVPVVVHGRWWVIVLALIAAALTPLGLRCLVVQDSWTSGFDPDSEFRRVTREVNEEFLGVHQLFVSFEAPQMLTGKVAASEFGMGTLALPLDWVGNPSLVDGSPITLFVADPARPGESNHAPIAVWQTQVQIPGRNGDRMILRLGPGNRPANLRRQSAGGPGPLRDRAPQSHAV